MPLLPKRRWLRFSLSTLLIAVTVGCLWLGWQVRIVRERKELRQWAKNQQITVTDTDYSMQGQAALAPMPDGRIYMPGFHIPPDQIGSLRRPMTNGVSWYRERLGDKPVYIFVVPQGYGDDPKVHRITALFPESFILVTKVF